MYVEMNVYIYIYYLYNIHIMYIYIACLYLPAEPRKPDIVRIRELQTDFGKEEFLH